MPKKKNNLFWKIILWTTICLIGFNLVASKGGEFDDFRSATFGSILVGPLFGILFFQRNKRRQKSLR